MSVWKVLVIAVFGCTCLALAMATVVVPITKTGGEWWLWMGGLLSGTLVTGILFTLFLRYAGRGLAASNR
jgi:hypothetical protein